MMQYELESKERMQQSCYAEYTPCGLMASLNDSEFRARLKNEHRIGKEFKREMSKAAFYATALNSTFTPFFFLAMPLAAFSIWSLNLFGHHKYIENYLFAVREASDNQFDHFFETRLEFLFPDFFAFWNNLNITTIAGQLGLSILLDVVMLGLQMLPDWGCIGRGRNKVVSVIEAPTLLRPVWPVND